MDTKALGQAGSYWTPLYGSSYYSGNRIVPGDYQLLTEYQTNGLVYACANLNAKGVSATPLRVYTYEGSQTAKRRKTAKLSRLQKSYLQSTKAISDVDDVVEVVSHPLVDVLTMANQYLNGCQLIHESDLFLETLGRAYWLIDRNPVTSLPDQIWLLPSQNVTALRDGNGLVTGYLYRGIGNADPQTLTVDNVIDFRFANLFDLYGGGLSPVAAAYTNIRLASSFTDYQNSVVGNFGRPDAMITPKGELGIDEAKLLERKYEEKFRSRGNGRLMVNGQHFDFTPLSYAPVDLGPLQITEQSLRIICNAHGVPEQLMSKEANRASADVGNFLHAKNAVLPRCNLFAQKINERLVPMYGDDSLFVAFDNPVPEDKESQRAERALEIQALPIIVSSGKITNDELRSFADLPPLDDATEGAAFVSAPAPASPEATPATAVDQTTDNAAPTPDAPEDGVDAPTKAFDTEAVLKINAAVSAGDMPRSVGINLVASVLDVPQVEAKAFVTFPKLPPCECDKCKSVVTHSEAMPTQVDPEWHKVAKVVKRNLVKLAAHYVSYAKHHKLLEPGITKALPPHFVPLHEWDRHLANEVKPVVEIFANDQAHKTLTRVGASPDVFAVVPAKIDEALDAASLRFAQSTQATIVGNLNKALDDIREQLREGIGEEGESIPRLTQRINEIVNDPDRAELIAQTETQRAVHRGQQIAAKESGVVKGFKLLVSSDACPLCLEFEDAEIGLDDKFNDSDTYDDSPLPIHPACRCTMLEILSDGNTVDDTEEGDQDS